MGLRQCWTSSSSRWAWPSSSASSATPSPATGSRRRAMLDLILGAAVSLGLFGYLLYALLRPERF
jgi:K+-transporting ATPase KdpF subunit